MLNEWEGTDWAGTDVVQARSAYEYPDFVTQLHEIQNRLVGSRPWRYASIKEAIGVPSIFRAASLIANTVGMLSMRAYKSGREVPTEDRPRIIVRPNPFTIPRDFYRNTTWDLATSGEFLWWVAVRDADDLALSLIPMPPREVTVEEDSRDLRFPVYRWRDRVIPTRDVIHGTFLRDTGELRGFGPLQACGAAVSVAVEAQEWAANMFAGGSIPSIGIRSALDIDDVEAGKIRDRWVSIPPNLPHVYGPAIEKIEEFSANPQGAQMLEAREYNNSDAARMFGIPGSLLETGNVGHGTVQYQNLETEMARFMRTCVIPGYLAPIEEAMSDLLVRNTVAKFHVDEILRADVKTRYDVYSVGITAGVLTVEQAQEMEGILPGNVENAPMPLALPQAVPASLPTQQSIPPSFPRAASAATEAAPRTTIAADSDVEVRCQAMVSKRRAGISNLTRCNRLLARDGTVPPSFCPRCKSPVPVAA